MFLLGYCFSACMSPLHAVLLYYEHMLVWPRFEDHVAKEQGSCIQCREEGGGACLGCRPFSRDRMSERKGLALPSTPFSAGKSDTMPSSTARCCTSSGVLSDSAQSPCAAEQPRT